jgi:hypothetical protein
LAGATTPRADETGVQRGRGRPRRPLADLIETAATVTAWSQWRSGPRAEVVTAAETYAKRVAKGKAPKMTAATWLAQHTADNSAGEAKE